MPSAKRAAVRKAAAKVKKITRQLAAAAKRTTTPKPITKSTRKPVKARWPPDQARVRAVLDGLQSTHGDATCELVHANAFQLLIATILSAQTTDERVNQVTPK